MPSPATVEKRLAMLEVVAREVFGYAGGPRPAQREVAGAVLRGERVLAVQPTGAGKSFNYQAPALILPGLTVVISPLLALMKDQVDKLKRWGVAADRLGGDQMGSEQARVCAALDALDIVFVSPERIKNRDFREALRRCKVALIAVDEAHCLSKWGREFRPSYAMLKDFTAGYPGVPVLVLTATADPQVEADVVRLLGLTDYRRIIGSPDRPNLEYTSSHEATVGDMARMVSRHLEGPGCALVYASTRAAVEELYEEMSRLVGPPGAYYHAGMDGVTRSVTQERFMQADIRWMVATNAFGMGVDKADVRFVGHWMQPGTVFDYAQEAGRGGRDGRPAQCHLNISRKGRVKREYFNRMANPDLWVYEKLWRIITGDGRIGAGTAARTSRDYIRSRMNLNDGIAGMQDAALAYLEFTGHFEVVPGPLTYRLPVRDAALCRRFARDHRCVRVTANVVTVTTSPEEDDPVPDMVREGAVHSKPPSEAVIFKLRRSTLGVTEAEIAGKRRAAAHALDQVEDFADAADKPAFLRDVFLQAARS